MMHGAFWVGVWPGLTDEMLAWVAESIRAFCRMPNAVAGAAP
jgi:hypothetical protein